MKKVIRLTESDLVRIVKRVINEQTNSLKFKVGDRLYWSPEPGSALKFKINKVQIDNDGLQNVASIEGTIIGVNGEFEGDDKGFDVGNLTVPSFGLNNKPSVKVGHPFHIQVNIDGPNKGGWSLYLFKQTGEAEYAGGSNFDKKFTKI
jgi:hypothetical protein